MSVAVTQIFKLKNKEFQTRRCHANVAAMTLPVFQIGSRASFILLCEEIKLES
jgi:hypothetical protein